MSKAFWIKPEDVPLYIQEIIFTKLTPLPEPYTYKLRGTYGGTVNTYQSATAALDKLTKWAERVGAEVKVVRDEFKEISNSLKAWKSGNVKHRRIIIEITDPASKAIDELIVRFRGGLYFPPQDRLFWEKYRESVK